MTPCTNPADAMLDAMRAVGIAPTDPGEIQIDGALHRFRVEGDKAGSRNGWAVLHHDHGAAGSWKSGVTCTWSSKSTARMTRQEKGEHFLLMRQAKAEAQRQHEGEHHAAAVRAAALWSKARPASATHPYLARKRIPPGPAHQQGERLLLRITDVDGILHGLQFIAPDGAKRMLSGTAKTGHFVIVAGSLPADLIVIAEGFATASTVAREFPGACTLAAIDAGNLEPVARAIRAKYQSAEIVIVADDDRLTPNNPGLTKGRAAAAAVHGKLVRPVWPDGASASLTDFNDLAAFMDDVRC